MVASGLNDPLSGNGASTGKQVTKGVKDLRATFRNSQLAICMVSDVQSKGGNIERAVVAVIKEIWRLGSQLNFALVARRASHGETKERERKREGRRYLPGQHSDRLTRPMEVRAKDIGAAFERDGFHFSTKVGGNVGLRLAGRAVASFWRLRALASKK